MRRLFIFSTLLLLFFAIIAQEKPLIVKVDGEWEEEWLFERESKEAAKARAEERAKVNALEKAFGTVVVQGNTTFVKNVNTGEKVETQTTFNMIGNTIVGGEIVEILKMDFKEREEKIKKGKGKNAKEVYIICNLVATAKKLSESHIEFDCFPLSGNTKNNATTTFYNKNDVYFYFKSPVSGYVSIYIDITGSGTTQRILPYAKVPMSLENGMLVKADKEYIFFSPAKNDEEFINQNVMVDEIYVSPDKDQELWRFFILFSKEPLNKPSLKEGLTENELTPEEKNKNVSVPKALNSEDFQRWMIRNMQIRNDFQKKIIDVSVLKNK